MTKEKEVIGAFLNSKYHGEVKEITKGMEFVADYQYGTLTKKKLLKISGRKICFE